MPFPYKTVLVTGATSGIGQALVERMVASSIFVIAVGRRQDRLDALLKAHGPEKVAIEQAELADLDGLPKWVEKITTAYPALDCVVLNAGFQQTVDFTNPTALPLAALTAEINTNYLSPLHSIMLFLPHLVHRAPNPVAVVLVTSGLALIPISRVPNYCATKAALHSLVWTLRSQLADPAHASTHGHLRVIEIVPPAVRTELHLRQGQAELGMSLADFTEETWRALTGEDVVDEIMPEVLRQRAGTIEDEKRRAFQQSEAMARGQAARPT